MKNHDIQEHLNTNLANLKHQSLLWIFFTCQICQLVRKFSDDLPIRINSLSSTPLRFLPRESCIGSESDADIILFDEVPRIRPRRVEQSNNTRHNNIRGRYTGEEVFVAWISMGKRTIQVRRGKGSHNISYARGEERGLAWGCEKRSHTYQAWPISLRCIGFQDNFLSSFILLPSLEPSRHIRT